MTFVDKRCVTLSRDRAREPDECVLRCLSVEMTRYSQETIARTLPLRIVHHRVEVTVPRVPATMIALRHALAADVSIHDHLGNVQTCHTRAQQTCEKFMV